MRKVKIMLMAILIMAIVGGALAFKTRKSFECIFTNTDTFIPWGFATCTLATGWTTTEAGWGWYTVRYKLTSTTFDCENPVTTTTLCTIDLTTQIIPGF